MSKKPTPPNPPQHLGIMPRQMWLQIRAENLSEAIYRSVTSQDMDPVGEWIKELAELWPLVMERRNKTRALAAIAGLDEAMTRFKASQQKETP